MNQNIPIDTQTIIQNELIAPFIPPKKPSLSQKQIYVIFVALAILILLVIFLVGFIFLKPKNTAGIVPSESEPLTKTEVITQNTTPTTQAVIDTTNWLTYNDPEVGFSFKYPKSVDLNTQSENPSTLSLSVNTEKLSDIPEELPMFMGRNDALIEKTRLAKGEGEGLVKIGSTYGQTSTTLSLFEVCSVMFYKKLTFYHGDYRIIVTLSAPKDRVIQEMPKFFIVDTTNCGENKIWNRDQNLDFNMALKNQLGTGIAQEWYNNFEAMTNTFVLTTPSGMTYKNEMYGFQLTYDEPYKLQTSKDDLYGYPHGVALLYSGGQAYDIVIEVWDNQADYQNEYQARISDLKVISSKGKFITFLNNTSSAENQKIIDSIKVIE